MPISRLRFLLLGVCCWQLLLGLPDTGRAASSGSSSGQLDVNFFYDTLKDDGSWFNTTEYGDVWQPYIAYKNDAWRPYTDGYWTYTDGGWMFVSYEDFGWAVYHYGRWTQLKDIGWAWVPGTEWAPAWVTWRESKPGDGTDNGQPAANVAATTTDGGDQATGNPPPPPPDSSGTGGGEGAVISQNYVGWAPLPPDPYPEAYGSYYSYGPSVDIDYGIDPYDYVFTDARYFGAPWIGGVIFGRDRGYDCAERSVNVTNVYYDRRGGYRGFYSGGPRYDRFKGVTERPIPRLNINREQGRAAQAAIRAGRFNQINGNRVNVAAPRFSQTNVRNGRVNFKNRGALPVSQVDRNGFAAQGDNGARDRARNVFRQQGEAFRAKNPNSQSARRAARQAARQAEGQPAGPAANPGIKTTPLAQQEERAARQEARQEARAGGEKNSDPAGNPNPGENPGKAEQPGPGQPANPVAAKQGGTKAERRAARQQTASAARAENRRNAASGASRQQAREARRAARQNNGSGARRAQRQSAPRVARAPRGGGGGRAMRSGGGGRGGGGGHAARGGGGGARGGGSHGGGGHGGGGKKK